MVLNPLIGGPRVAVPPEECSCLSPTHAIVFAAPKRQFPGWFVAHVRTRVHRQVRPGGPVSMSWRGRDAGARLRDRPASGGLRPIARRQQGQQPGRRRHRRHGVRLGRRLRRLERDPTHGHGVLLSVGPDRESRLEPRDLGIQGRAALPLLHPQPRKRGGEGGVSRRGAPGRSGPGRRRRLHRARGSQDPAAARGRCFPPPIPSPC